MAVRFDTSGEKYTRSLTIPSAWTVCFWFLMSVDRGGNQGPFALGGTAADGATVFLDGGTTLKCFDLGSNGGGFGSLSVTVGTWYRTALTVSGTNCSWYYGIAGSALTVSSVANIQNASGTQTMHIGDPSFSGDWWNGRVAAVKFWDAQLSQADLEAELGQYVPRRTSNLLQWHPLLSAGTVDYSGIGNALSGGSGATTEDGPPVPWGPLRTKLILPATAISAAAGGTAALGLAATGTAAKVATQGGSCSLGASATGTARRAAPCGGAAALAVSGTAMATRVALGSGTCTAAVAAQAVAQKTAPAAGLSCFAVAATGQAVKTAPTAGHAVAVLFGAHSGVVVRAVAGACSLMPTVSGRASKLAPAGGSTCAALAVTAQPTKTATPGGVTVAGLSGTGTAQHIATGSGITGAVLCVVSAAGKRSPQAGAVAVLLTGYAEQAPGTTRGSMTAAARTVSAMTAAAWTVSAITPAHRTPATMTGGVR